MSAGVNHPRVYLGPDPVQNYTDALAATVTRSATTRVNGPSNTSVNGVTMPTLNLTLSPGLMGPFNISPASPAGAPSTNGQPVLRLNTTAATNNANMGPEQIFSRNPVFSPHPKPTPRPADFSIPRADPKPASFAPYVPDDSAIKNIAAGIASAQNNITSGLQSAFNFVPQDRGNKLGKMKKPEFKANDPNWKGTTDNILTSGRGVTTSANVSRKKLLGS
jgi:hypothetical protein